MMYDIALSAFAKCDAVGRELKCLIPKEDAVKFIEDFLREVIKSYCKDYYCLSAVGTDGFYDYNYKILLSKDVTVYIHIDAWKF